MRSITLATKRVIDVVVSAAALVLLAPILTVVALAVYVAMGRPVFYHQARAGMGGRSFSLLKFRSMMDACGPDGHLLPDLDRLTGLGRFIRRWSIDELPQFWNVLKGDMTLVGPRPLPVSYVQKLDDRQSRRCGVRPGITGWAQVCWRDPQREWAEKLEKDVWYTENLSLWLDAKILLLTMPAVLRRALRNKSGESTSSEFVVRERPSGEGEISSGAHEDERP